MQKVESRLQEIKLIGIAARTNNVTEASEQSAQIGETIQKYFGENIPSLITNKKNPGTTYCVYTDYESNEHGYYTYFIGEEVSSFDDVHADLKTLTIPAQDYIKFTTVPGVMPGVCIDAWKKIWQMNAEDLGGKRAFIADFEVYDKRAIDPQSTTLDIFIGIE